MSSIQFVLLIGMSSLMVLSGLFVMFLAMVAMYKIDPTYPELGFWGNTRLEIAGLIAGKFAR